jgi:succinylglutamate desuccinylase
VDAALAAVDAFDAEFGGFIPQPYGPYVKAVLDALNFLAVELQKTPSVTWKQVVSDALRLLVPLELTDFSGLTSKQAQLAQAITAAILALLSQIKAQAPPRHISAMASAPQLVDLNFWQRHEVRSRISKIEKLKAKIKTGMIYLTP